MTMLPRDLRHLVFGGLAALGLASAASAKELQAQLVEIAPLRGAIGALSIRGETMPWPHVAFAAAYDQSSGDSERAGYHDASTALAAEALWYPVGQRDYPVFFAAGLRQEEAVIGRQRARPALTWARTNSDETLDRWSNHDRYLSMTQAVGYRMLSFGFMTMSLRFERDALLSWSTSAQADDVRSADVDLASPGRVKTRQRVSLYAGLYLP